MELAALLWTLLKSYWWLAALPVLAAILKSPALKGWWGEYLVRDLIRRRLDTAVYREFHNVTVRDEFGDTTQIDHIYVSPFGVLVIETKHMTHWISGSRQQPLWTQQIYHHKIRFQNPLRQNHRHIKVLESLLALPEDVFKSIVVFTGDCTFRTEMPDEVCTLSDLIEYIHSIDEEILTGGQVESICRDLHQSRLEPSFRTNREHIESLRRRHATTAAAKPVPSPDMANLLANAAAERLLLGGEDRIRRGGGRRSGSGMAQLGAGGMVAKGVLFVGTIFLIWWVISSGIGKVVRSLQPPQPVSTSAPESSTAPTPEPTRAMIPVVAPVQQQPGYRDPTAEEIAEWQRQSEESMRILERNTREIPLALPGSPQVGPAAQ